jgi:hypothetical protein
MSDDIARLVGLDVAAIHELYNEEAFAQSLPAVSRAELAALREWPKKKKSIGVASLLSATATGPAATATASSATVPAITVSAASATATTATGLVEGAATDGVSDEHTDEEAAAAAAAEERPKKKQRR